MLRAACCLLLFPAIVCAQQPEEPLPQLNEAKETANEPAPPDAGPSQIVMIEVTMLQIAGHLQIQDAGNIDTKKLQQAFRDAQEQGSFRHLTRVKLATLELIEATFQMGATESVAEGTRGFSRGPDGRPVAATSYRRQETGTIAMVTPNVMEDGTIMLNIEFEQSRLRPVPPTSNEDASTIPPATDTTTLRTTLTTRDGQTVLAGAFQSTDPDGESLETLILVGASTRK